MIPKQDHQVNKFKHFRPRSESWSSIYEVNGPILKPLGYSNQPPAYDFSCYSIGSGK